MTQIVGLLPKAGICNLKTHAWLHDRTRLPTSDRGESAGGDERVLLRLGRSPVTSSLSFLPAAVVYQKTCLYAPPLSARRASLAESRSPAERLRPELSASAKDFSLSPPLLL